MQPATLDHYVVMVGLEHLRAVFEEMYNEATVVMNRTRTPYHGGGIIFKFKAAIVTTIGQVREMMTTSMISEGEDIVSKMDDGGRTSHNGLGSLAMLHHECRRMAAHVGNAGEKSSIIEDRPEKATQASGQNDP